MSTATPAPPPALREALAEALGAGVVGARPVAGGDINDAWAVRLADGREVFVKSDRDGPDGMFAAEARGLAWLAEPGAVRVPRVLAVSPGAARPAFLALELIEPARRARDFDERLGHGLATLHRAGAVGFGLDHDNFIATLGQDNAAASTPGWAAFYVERRLAPQIRLAVERGRAPARWLAWLEPLAARLPALLGDPEPAARLHGDLWSGNVHVDEAGAPVLIDPAVYGGHREIDLAMLALFGRVSDVLVAAYDEVHPLGAGWRERVELHQLYPLLVHVNLFGGGYVESVAAIVRRLLC